MIQPRNSQTCKAFLQLKGTDQIQCHVVIGDVTHEINVTGQAMLLVAHVVAGNGGKAETCSNRKVDGKPLQFTVTSTPKDQ